MKTLSKSLPFLKSLSLLRGNNKGNNKDLDVTSNSVVIVNFSKTDFETMFSSGIERN